MSFSAVWAFIMPAVTNSVYFHNSNPTPTAQPIPSTKNNIHDDLSTSQERNTSAATKSTNKVI